MHTNTHKPTNKFRYTQTHAYTLVPALTPAPTCTNTHTLLQSRLCTYMRMHTLSAHLNKGTLQKRYVFAPGIFPHLQCTRATKHGVHINTNAHTQTHRRTHTHTLSPKHTSLNTYAPTHAHAYTRIHTYTHTHAYTHTPHTHTHTNTHTTTQTQKHTHKCHTPQLHLTHVPMDPCSKTCDSGHVRACVWIFLCPPQKNETQIRRVRECDTHCVTEWVGVCGKRSSGTTGKKGGGSYDVAWVIVLWPRRACTTNLPRHQL